MDPLHLGRCRCRVIGIHTDSKADLPTDSLPWATPIQPITSAAMSGIGHAPVGPVEGTWVVIQFLDDAQQYPVITGTIAGIPGLITNMSDADASTITNDQIAPPGKPETPAPIVTTGSGGQLTDSTGTPVTSTNYGNYIGTLSKDQVGLLKEAIAEKESGSKGYSAVNSLNYLGKYQMGSAILQDLGYVVKGTSSSSKVLVNDSVWTGKDNITSQQAFLTSGPVQEDAMDMMLKTMKKRIDHLVDTTSMPPEKLAGLLAVAHLKGTGKGGVKDFLNGGGTPDAYGTTPKKYYDVGYNAIAGKTTAEAPTMANAAKPAPDKNLPNNLDNSKYAVPDGTASATPPQQGFTDPNGKYPLKDWVNEPEVSRLARVAKIQDTIVGEKQANRNKGIPVANGGHWDQPACPYSAQYPYNHVYQSESGHLLEFDDTPGAERINLHHTVGTYIEIDAEGNQVNNVYGSRIVIVEDNELVYIKGSGHITVDGDITINAGKSCQIQVAGDANISIAGSVYQSVGGDFNIKAGGNINLDGAEIFFNSGAATGVQSYSPNIVLPTAPTINETNDMLTEDTPPKPDPAAPPTTIKQIDSTPPLPVIPVSTTCDFGVLTMQTQISMNYTLQQLCQGKPTFHPFPLGKGQHGIADKEIACNLRQLCINVIEPLREKYSSQGFFFTNTFREAGNGISKSKNISQHELGMAGDFQWSSLNRDRAKYFTMAQEIKNFVTFDQLLLEYRDGGSVWIHISFNPTKNRKQVLTLNNDKTYAQGLVLIS